MPQWELQPEIWRSAAPRRNGPGASFMVLESNVVSALAPFHTPSKVLEHWAGAWVAIQMYGLTRNLQIKSGWQEGARICSTFTAQRTWSPWLVVRALNPVALPSHCACWAGMYRVRTPSSAFPEMYSGSLLQQSSHVLKR